MQKAGNRLLLHACCAPCSSAALRELNKDYSVSYLFYNPNIFPPKEYEMRLEEIRKICSIEGIELIEQPYDHDSWLESARRWADEPEGGKRCLWCYEDRLRATAIVARDRGFDIIATTLTLSPHKNADKINEIGKRIENEERISYLPSNFKKKGGYNYSIEYSKRHGLKRQNYCGCEFSMRQIK